MIRFQVKTAICLLFFVPKLAFASQTSSEKQKIDPSVLSNLEWRNIGPAVTGGRIVNFAVVESNPNIIFAATASGGAWKSTNAGITWTPVFEKEKTVSIGGIAVAASNPNVVWIGTGEPNARNMRSTSWGDGVYKSEDGGKSWKNMGLELSQHIGRIAIHPQDPDIVYVSCLGTMWGNDPERNDARGLFKTTDGGKTWTKVLSAGEQAGIVEVVMDPSDPDRLYAGAWHRERRDWSFFNTGTDGGIFRSDDGGENWERLTNGLPESEIGRVGLAVCRSRPDRLYAVLEGEDGGIYRSDNRGASWEHLNDQPTASMYYGQVRCDPNDPERVYGLQTPIFVSDDGGQSFNTDMAREGVHVDHHALWINPADSDHLLLGNDGGIYISYDRGRSCRFAANLPITQFYTVAVDMQEPYYYVYGGTQDNNSLGGPSGTRNIDGIVNDDWAMTVGGDGFFLQIDPVRSVHRLHRIPKWKTGTLRHPHRRASPRPTPTARRRKVSLELECACPFVTARSPNDLLRGPISIPLHQPRRRLGYPWPRLDAANRDRSRARHLRLRDHPYYCRVPRKCRPDRCRNGRRPRSTE